MGRREHFALGAGLSVPALAQARQDLGASGPPIDYLSVVKHPDATRALAAAYRAMPDYDPAAAPAYRAMANETGRQFDHLGKMGINVEVTSGDPYSGPRDMMEDILHNNRLRVLSTHTTGGHPMLTDDQNDMFRAVHDAFGHAATGRGFDRHGEEAAYLSHSQMFSPLARRALATETRGQNSMFNETGEFPEQKAALMPATLAGVTPLVGRRAAFRAAADQARTFHATQGLLT